jgi:uncharacterized protein
MVFTWDERKAQVNQAKHGIAFDLAIEVFNDPNRVEGFSRNVAGEVRMQVIGAAGMQALILFVAYTERREINGKQKTIRIISARKASRKERRRYAALS